jgi:hypothetical protein
MAQKILEGQDLHSFDYSQKKFINKLNIFFESSFKEDKRFVLLFLARLTRDRLKDLDDVLNSVFYDKVFKVIIEEKKKENDFDMHNAFQIMSNMIYSETHRKKLANGQYFKRIFDKV